MSPRVARRLFGRTAWGCYGGAAVFALGVLAARPDLRPSWEHAWWLTDPLLSLLAYLPVGLLLVATHEAWHWLAGRAAGVPAAFRVSYRGIWVVFETDLSQLVTIDRRRRYGPFLAGMAIDAVLLALALGLRLLYREELLQVPPVVDRFLGAVVFYQVVVIIWQWAAIPFRTDGYAVLANALGCHNLYRTTWLTLKDRLVVIGADERAELDRADARDRSVAAWFAVLYLAGATVMAWSFMTFAVPLLLVMGGWAITNLASLAASTAAFWESLAVLAYLIANLALPPLLALREHRTGRSREVTP